MRKFLLLFFFINSVLLPAFAQVKFTTVIAETAISKEDYIQVQYIVENAGSVESITPPSFPGFTVVSGPMQQTGMSIINGNTSKYEGVTYVLKPSVAGKFTVGGANAVVDGRQMHSNSVAVSVTNGPSRQLNNSNNPLFGFSIPEEAPEVNEEYVLRKGESAAEKIKNNLFVKLDVSKTTCYAGEPVVAVYKLYSRLKSESRVTKRPSLSQFSVYDMVQPEANGPTIEKIGGKLYNAHVIRKVQLYPLQDGSFDLDPVEVDNTVRFLRLDNSNNKTPMQQLLDDYMNGVTDGRMEEQKLSLASKPVTITVKPLPASGKPGSFDGAVGKFTLSASVPQAEIAAGETAVMNVILKGEGNLTLINAPQVAWPQGTEGYEPIVKETIDKTVSPMSGTKMFQFSFTAKQQGQLVIPPIEFSYFNPAANAYKTTSTAPITITISKALNKPKQVLAVKPASAENYDWKKLLWVSPLALLIIFGSLYVFTRKKKPVKKVPARPVQRTIVETLAPAAPADPFEAAKFALAAVNSQLFYKETGKAVWHILSEKFKLTSSEHSKPIVVRLLQQTNAAPETIGLLESVLNDCELALYTPVHTENDMRHTLDKAERLKSLL